MKVPDIVNKRWKSDILVLEGLNYVKQKTLTFIVSEYFIIVIKVVSVLSRRDSKDLEEFRIT